MNREIKTGVYEGETDPRSFSRSLEVCETLWNESEVKPGSFDSLLEEQILKAIEEGRDEVVVMDLGSGDGSLIKGVVEDKGEEDLSRTKKSRSLLGQNPNLRIRLVGLTDAQRPEDFLKRKPIIPESSSSPETDTQITAENVHFSVTPDQTLHDFASEMGIEKADLIVSTSFFLHLNPDLFEQVMNDSISLLRDDSGVMVAAGYHAELEGYMRWFKAETARAKLRNNKTRQSKLIQDYHMVSRGVKSNFYVDIGLNRKDKYFNKLKRVNEGRLAIESNEYLVVVKKNPGDINLEPGQVVDVN